MASNDQTPEPTQQQGLVEAPSLDASPADHLPQAQNAGLVPAPSLDANPQDHIPQQPKLEDHPDAPWVQSFKADFQKDVMPVVRAVPRAIGSAYDAMKEGVKQIVPPDATIEDFVASGEKSIDDMASAGLWTMGKAWNALTAGVGIADRMVGTGYAKATQALWDSKTLEMAKRRDVQMQLGGTPEDPQPRTFPVSLAQDLIQEPAEYSLRRLGNYMQQSGSPIVKKTGEGVEGFAGLGGIAAAMLIVPKTDPTMMLSFGTLTEEGMALEKAGSRLGEGFASQVARGERDLVAIKPPLMERMGVLPSVTAKVAPPVLNKISQGLIYLEQSKIGQAARYITTDPGWGSVKNDAQELQMGLKGVEYNSNLMMRNAETIASRVGIDTSNPDHLKALYAYLDNPSSYSSEMSKVVPPQAAQAVHSVLSQQLQSAVEDARNAGLKIGEFVPDADQLGASERYVPRGSTLSQKQALQLKERLADLSESTNLLEGAAGKKVDLGFLEQRSKLNKEYINQKILEKYGIQDYFHDNAVMAYAEKTEQVRIATAQKKFVDRLIEQFPSSTNDWVKGQAAARDWIKGASGSVDPQIYRLAYTNLDNIRSLDSKVYGKVAQLAGQDISNLKLPGPVADFVEGTFRSAKPSTVQEALLSYNQAYKNALFANPGFHLRQMYHSAVSADNAGVGVVDGARALRAVWTGTGDKGTLSNLAEYESMTGGGQGILHGVNLGVADETTRMSNLEQRYAAAKVYATKDMVEGDTPYNRLMGSLRHMAATMGEQGFVKTVKSIFSPSNLVDNPIYRFSGAATEYGEKGFRFAVYNKFREDGYDPESAMGKVYNQFVNYELNRTALRSTGAQMAGPFMNFAVKNAELVGRMIAQNPKNFMLYGPGGTFERALSDWQGWNPGQIYRMRELYGPWYGEHVLGEILPGEAVMHKQKDYVQGIINSWLSTAGDEQEGYQILTRLPTNYHALHLLDPMALDDMQGPLVKMGLAMLNKDPFTGEPLSSEKSDVSWVERSKRAAQELAAPVGGLIPTKAIQSAQLLLGQRWPEVRERMLNMGMDEEEAKLFFGDPDNDKWRDKAMKALETTKMLWLGSVTKADIDANLRMRADMKDTKDQIDIFKNKAKSGNMSFDVASERIQGMRDRLFERMDRTYQLLDEYQVRSDAALNGDEKRKPIMLDDITVVPDDAVTLKPPVATGYEPPTPKASEAKALRNTLKDGIIVAPLDADPSVLKKDRKPQSDSAPVPYVSVKPTGKVTMIEDKAQEDSAKPMAPVLPLYQQRANQFSQPGMDETRRKKIEDLLNLELNRDPRDFAPGDDSPTQRKQGPVRDIASMPQGKDKLEEDTQGGGGGAGGLGLALAPIISRLVAQARPPTSDDMSVDEIDSMIGKYGNDPQMRKILNEKRNEVLEKAAVDKMKAKKKKTDEGETK